MLPSNLRVVLLIGVIAYFIIVLMMLKNKTLHLRYTLLWLAAGFVLGIMVFWPETLVQFIHLLGIADNMNGLFVVCLTFVIMILMSLTAIISRQADKIKNLTQTIARMEKRLRELEDQ